MKKKLLILGAGNAQIDLIKYAKDKGFEVHGVSYTNTDSGIPMLDYFEQINIIDTEKVEEYVKKNSIDYIYSVGSDIAVPTFCKVAENLDMFHFVSSKTAEICCNKHMMRDALGKSNFNLPFMYCSNLVQAKKADFYPLMIKPVDSQGQRGVYSVKSYEELEKCFEQSICFSKSGQVILEKFVLGDEASVNAYVYDGKVIFSMLSDRESFNNLPGGIIKAHHLPSKYENTCTKQLVEELVSEAVTKLEINNGPVYFQIKIENGHPYLIEVTPRLDGCHMWRLIKEYTGVNLLDITMTHFLDGTVADISYNASDMPMHTEFFCEAPDTEFDISKYEKYTGDIKCFYYKTGDRVRRMNGYMEKCGYRIFAAPHRLALIGGSGFIGSTFKSMYSENFEITDVSRKSSNIVNYDYNELLTALTGCDSAVILAAKKVNAKEKQSLELYEDNIKIVENSLEACKTLGIKNIVFVSSRCVYSNSQASPIPESGDIAPINYYGISKYTGEMLCEYYNRNYGMNIKILRLSQVIGKSEGGYMTELFVKNALCGEKLSLYGKSEGKRDYIYVKDACLGIKKALEAYEKTGIYNIGSGIGTTSKQLAESVIKGFNSVSETVQLTDKKEDTSISFLDVTKAKNELCFECAYSLEAAFADLKKEL